MLNHRILLHFRNLPTVLPRSVFIHIPKTGGTWVRASLVRSGVPLRIIGDHHSNPRTDKNEPWMKNRVLFSCVRHPCTWFQSYWSWAQKTGIRPQHPFGALALDYSFMDFIDTALEMYPEGVLKFMYTLYMGEELNAVDHICRFENLEDDLIRLMRIIGENINEDAMRSTPHKNIASRDVDFMERCFLDKETRLKICRHESWAMSMFDYNV